MPTASSLRSMIQQQIHHLQQQPQQAVAQKLAALDQAISGLPTRQAAPGRVTMRQHLTALRQQIADQPQVWLTRRQAELQAVLKGEQ